MKDFSVMLVDNGLKFKFEISGTGTLKKVQNLTLNVNLPSTCEFQISKLFYIFKKINK